MARNTAVALKPLFDRLTDENPYVLEESPVERVLSDDALRLSIVREIDRILTSRYVQLNWSDPDRPDAYGMPDMLAFDPNSLEGWPFIEQSIRRAIQRYEPRLKDVYVVLQSYDRPFQAIHVAIGGTMMNGIVMEPVSFPIHVRIQAFNS